MKKLNKDIILSTLAENKVEIRNLGVKKLILFGSYARNEQNENSDIDFLVEFDNKKNSVDNYLDLLFF